VWLESGFIFGDRLVLRLGLVVADDPFDAVFIPAGWELVLIHDCFR
jgi:hypothetical protein